MLVFTNVSQLFKTLKVFPSILRNVFHTRVPRTYCSQFSTRYLPSYCRKPPQDLLIKNAQFVLNALQAIPVLIIHENQFNKDIHRLHYDLFG